MRAVRRLAATLALGVALAAPAVAQQDLQPLGVLLLDQERFFADSRFGQRIQAEIDAESRTLQAENRKIEADLEAEEKSLTERRATLPPEEFRALADAFDAKVKDIRTARDAKANDLATRREAARKTFIETAVPVLAQIMGERGAAAIIDRSAVVISFDRIDITDLAIARIDLLLAPEGATEPPPQRPATPPAAAPADPPPQPPAGEGN
jgi:Skp family chaperone for outer membrane proteins